MRRPIYVDHMDKDKETLYLLSLQRQLNEYLLQFLIDKVDAELFKSIFLRRKQHS